MQPSFQFPVRMLPHCFYILRIMLLACALSAQVVELQNRLSEESKKADKMEFEYKRLKEKVDSLQKEKDVCTFQISFY